MSMLLDALGWMLDHPSFLLVGFLLYVFVYVVSLFLSGPRPGPNPFKADSSRPPKPLVTDNAERDKVLKQAFHPKRIPENLDAIVIGSGVGGLSTAALLSKAGKKVLVLEQHDQAGGCCHTFIEKGFEFDVGIHYIGEMRNNTISRTLVNQVTDGQLQWCDLIDEFDVVALGEPGKQKFIPFHSGSKEAWKASMMKYFPKEEKAIDKYLDLLKQVRQSTFGHISIKFMSKWMVRILINTGLIKRFTKFFSFGNRTVKEVLDELTDNQELKAVLSYSFGDYGTIPSRGSFSMHAALINHYLYGASYPRGGASEISFHMIPVIEKSGGKVLVRASVSDILIDDKGRAKGVRVEKTSGAVDVFAPLVISDAGVINTFKKLLPEETARKSSIYKLIKKKTVDSGIGCLSLFVGLKGTSEELNLKGENIWAFTGTDLDRITEDYLNLSSDDATEIDVPLMFVSFPSTKDPTYNDRFPGKSACTVVTLARWEWFKDWKEQRVNKRGEDYKTIKNAFARRIWNQVLAIYPQLEDKVEYFELGSPVTNNHYIRSPKGEIYGLDHNTDRFGSAEVVSTLRPDTDIPRLMLTGQDVLNCGFMGALFGGFLCASKVLNRNLLTDIVKLKNEIAKTK